MLNDRGCRHLAAAIVAQALKDYQKASAVLLIAPDNRTAQADVEEIEAFFESDWFHTLREFAPETISENILEDLKNDSKRILKSSLLPGQKDKSKRKTA